MKKEIKKEKPLGKKSSAKRTEKIPPFPVNPPSEDIYRKSIEEQDIDPEDTTKTKTLNEDDAPVKGKRKKKEKRNEKDFEDDVSGDDLDVPGADDEERINGEEDEENDYYSLGGDDHNDLDEDRGD